VGLWGAGRRRPATAASLWTGETPVARRSSVVAPSDEKFVKIKVAWIGKTKEPAIQALTEEYLKRIGRYVEVAGVALKDEAAILSLATGEGQQKQKQKKERHKLVLVDSRGKQLSSEELAEFLEREQVNATPLLFAIGGSDGFSDEARRCAGFTLSLGKMTLPHELARVVLVEQLYRAFTILANHPYHLGH
jgi:23S rRNA (pseudouridine1915-N3)-methyltransferase